MRLGPIPACNASSLGDSVCVGFRRRSPSVAGTVVLYFATIELRAGTDTCPFTSQPRVISLRGRETCYDWSSGDFLQRPRSAFGRRLLVGCWLGAEGGWGVIVAASRQRDDVGWPWGSTIRADERCFQGKLGQHGSSHQVGTTSHSTPSPARIASAGRPTLWSGGRGNLRRAVSTCLDCRKKVIPREVVIW